MTNMDVLNSAIKSLIDTRATLLNLSHVIESKEYFKEYYSGSEDLQQEDIKDLLDFAKLLEDKAEELKFEKTGSFQESDNWLKP